MTKIIAGSASKKVAYNLSKHLKIEYLNVQIEHFADQELRVQILGHVHKDDVIIVQSTSKPANDNLIELFLLVDAAKQAGAGKVIAVIPYFGYSRQDRVSYEGGPISAKLVANLLEASGVNHIITLDLHSKEIEKFFKIDIQNIDPIPLLADAIEEKENLIVVSPDAGSLFRAQTLAKRLNVDFATISKSRSIYNHCQADSITGEVAGKNCLIVDDIVDTGETLSMAASLLKSNGALKIDAIITHPVLSQGSVQNLDKASIDRIITTNSIMQNSLSSKFAVIDIARFIAQSIKF